MTNNESKDESDNQSSPLHIERDIENIVSSNIIGSRYYCNANTPHDVDTIQVNILDYYLHILFIIIFEVFFYFYYIVYEENSIFTNAIQNFIFKVMDNEDNNQNGLELIVSKGIEESIIPFCDMNKGMSFTSNQNLERDMYRVIFLLACGIIPQILLSKTIRSSPKVFGHLISKSLFFILLLGIFEYTFFKQIVEKYKVIDPNKEICDIILYYNEN